MSEEQENQTSRINQKLLRFTQALLMIITGFLLVSHILKWKAIQVDPITLALVGLLLLIPLVDLIRKIKLGNFEAEIGGAEVAKVQAKAVLELPPPTEQELVFPEEQIRELLQSDPRLAMAKIRIELEEALKQLYMATGESDAKLRKMSLGRLVDVLVQRQVLMGPIASSIRDVIALANRAVHGERVVPSAADELAILGVRLIHEIKQTYLRRVLKPVEQDVITGEEVERYRAAQYRVSTVVPLVENPIKNVYFFNLDALESFLEGYEEYAEFIIAVERM